MKKKIADEGKPFYHVWMLEVSDNIQSLATAFAERHFLQSAFLYLNNLQAGSKSRDALEKIIRLHSLTLVRQNLGWYRTNGVITKKSVAEDLERAYQQAVKDLNPYVNDIIEAFDYPKIPELHAPIARDYAKYNTQKNMDDVTAANGFFDITKVQAKL